MAQHDEKATGAGSEYAGSTVEGAMSAINTTSKNMQAIASEMLEISKQSFAHTTQALEKLRQARDVDEVVAIQTNFVKEAFEHAAQHARKFSELMTAFPAQITKTYQDAWLKSVNSTVKATETASHTAAENSDRLADAARKTSNVFDPRESA
jgi:phasin family protein